MKKTHLLIDGNNMAYRLRYGIGDQPNLKHLIVEGYINQLALHLYPNVVTCTVVFDAGIPEIRHRVVPEYKEQRDPNGNQVIYDAMDYLEELLPHIGVNVIKLDGYEADDVIYAVSQSIPDNILIISSDKDMYQCLTKDQAVQVYNPNRQKRIVWESIVNSYGVTPDQWASFRSLTGDKSDNIPGVKGIGKVYARELLQVFGTVKSLIQYLLLGVTKDQWNEDVELPNRCYDLLMADLESVLAYEQAINLINTFDAVVEQLAQNIVFNPPDMLRIERVAFDRGIYPLLHESWRFGQLEGLKGYLYEWQKITE